MENDHHHRKLVDELIDCIKRPESALVLTNVWQKSIERILCSRKHRLEKCSHLATLP